MDIVINYLLKKGYEVSYDYYKNIDTWIKIWKGKSAWLDVSTTNNNKYEMYTFDIAKRSCEDFASMLTSEEYDIKSNNQEQVDKEVSNSKILEMLPKNLEKMAYTGTIASVVRLNKVSVDENGNLKKTAETSKKVITVKGNQIIPLRVENDEIIDIAIVSKSFKIINNKKAEILYIEIHELTNKGYKITNTYITRDGKEYKENTNIPSVYYTNTNVPMFSVCKINKESTFKNSMGLGESLFANAISQLKIVDLTYNNFGTDFKLGQKLMIVNKKLTQEVIKEVTDENGNKKNVKKIIYPSDNKKQLFQELDSGLMTNDNDKVYVHEYNPDLRVGDNKDGVQFAIDTYSFKIGFGTKYYQFTDSGVVTATQYTGERQDMVANGVKNRKAVKNYLINLIKALLISEQVMNEQTVENITIDIPDVDNFLEDDALVLERARTEVASGLMSKLTYLIKYKGLSEKEARAELELINNENKITFSPLGE